MPSQMLRTPQGLLALLLQFRELPDQKFKTCTGRFQIGDSGQEVFIPGLAGGGPAIRSE